MKVTKQYEGVTESGMKYHVALIDTKETPMSANSRQEGGHHYQSDYQHWDWVEEIDMDYLLAAATKYLTRWRQKGNGVVDIKKAIHYVEKRAECAARLVHRRARLPVEHIRHETNTFLALNPQIPPNEHMIFVQLAVWTSRKQLIMARDMLVNLLEREVAETVSSAPGAQELRDVAEQMKGSPVDLGYVSPRAG